MTDTDRWWHRLDSTGYVRARLLCIPHAGAGAVAYLRWPELLDMEEMSLHAAQLPGRGGRLREAPIDDLPRLVDALVESVAPLLKLPYFLFGHSLGALLAFELTRALRRKKLPLPLRLMVSGRPAPQLPVPTPQLHPLPRETFLAELARRYGHADTALDDPEMAELLYPVLRADIAAVERYRWVEEAPLPLPIEAFVGQDDPAVDAEALKAWQPHTTSPVRCRTLVGGHFYLLEQPAALLALLRRSMNADLAGW